ncbi:hypothetical protein [Alicyclobacillus vulcanalis]|uniref:hypothetical protein n=1 Tax=Alicyclobacillus vulcanalis TaxID=252246 RepID=UPI0011774DFA|nr:hypothetical protein [Alicyclobacillus vulcanalis]
MSARVGAFFVMVVCSLAVGAALCAIESYPWERLWLIALSTWWMMGTIRVTSHGGLGAMTLLPYSRLQLTMVRAVAAYARLTAWLATGFVLFSSGSLVLGAHRAPSLGRAWLWTIATLAVTNAGLALVSAVRDILQSDRIRWLATTADGAGSAVFILHVAAWGHANPLSNVHAWWIAALICVFVGAVSAVMGTRRWARGAWLLPREDAVDRVGEETVGLWRLDRGQAREQGEHLAKPRASGRRRLAERPYAQTFGLAVHMSMRRAVWPFGGRGALRMGTRTGLASVLGPVAVLVVLVLLNWHTRHLPVVVSRIEDGMLGGAWLWSMFSPFSVLSVVEGLGDWFRGWPVRKGAVLAGFALIESLGTWVWISSGMLAGVIVLVHAAGAHAAQGAHLRDLALAWLIGGCASTWNTVVSAALWLRPKRSLLSAWFVLDVLVGVLGSADGARAVAWLGRAPLPVSLAAVVGAVVCAIAALALSLRTVDHAWRDGAS